MADASSSEDIDIIEVGDRVTIVAPWYPSQKYLLGFSGIVAHVTQHGIYHVEIDTPNKDINRIFLRKEIGLTKRRLYGRRIQLET